MTANLRRMACAAVLMMAGVASAYTSASKHLNKPAEWFESDEGKSITVNVLAWQTAEGGWPKNLDTGAAKPDSAKKPKATFDNSAGFYEVQYLAHAYNATNDPACKSAIERAIDYILAAQYDNGGWPQSYPSSKEGYDHYITFNDGTMARLMFLLRDVCTAKHFAFVDDDRKAKARLAWDKGIDCILKCQVRVKGKLTVWCAQHDEKDFSPKPARAFEPVALSGQESLALMNILMHVEKPTPKIVAAVDAAAAWFEASKITGIRIEDRPQEGTPKGFDRFVVPDENAPPLWARFYEIETNRPIFTGRDGVPKYSLAEIELERRTGYRWYGSWAKARLEKEYPAWKAKISGDVTSASTTQPTQ